MRLAPPSGNAHTVEVETTHYERTAQLTDRVGRSVTRALDNYRTLIADRPIFDSEQLEPTRSEPNTVA